MHERVRRLRFFLPVIFIVYLCFLYLTLVIPFQNTEAPNVQLIHAEPEPKTHLADRLDVTSRNYRECLEIRDNLAKVVELNNNIKNWKRWMTRQQICESYRERLEILQREWDEKKQD